MDNQKRRPAHEIRLGGVKAAVWKNHSDKTGTWYSVTIARLYKQGNSWKSSDSFGPSELPLVSKVADQATQWIQALDHAAASGTPESTMPN